MKKRPKKPTIPSERSETVRQEIISLLTGQTVSAKEISGQVRVPEKEVYSHLEHIQKTLSKKEGLFRVTPAECRKCGFVFQKRKKLKKPGKCPVCHGESIRDPLFSLVV
jgi:predicted Zn-ribbon and HTH transcriptional regulator